jgi:hemolysin III
LAPESFEQLSIIAYLLLGWMVMIVRRPLQTTIPAPGMFLLAAGGVLYTVGIVFFLWESLPYNTPIWHGFVLAGAALHYICIVGYVTGPTALKLAPAATSRG